jgi:enoyl-CoA hydratase/carnithine racemase
MKEADQMSYENLRVELRGEGPLRASLITLARPAQLNALIDALMDELTARCWPATPHRTSAASS